MCGRYSLSRTEDLWQHFEISEVHLPPRFNIAPTQEAPIILRDEDRKGQLILQMLHWGLVPSWRSKLEGPPMINARSETVAQRPSFREAFRERRCLVPADGFYEWQKRQGGKQPFYFCRKDRGLFAFAGLWEGCLLEQGDLQSYAILTCDANDLVSRIHSRMPVIVGPEDYGGWLDPTTDMQRLKELLRPYPTVKMKCYAVSRKVNKPQYDDPSCLKPQELQVGLF